MLLKKNAITDVKLFQLFEYSRELAEKVEKQGFTPDHVLYVERAGLFIGYEMAQYFGCPLSGIHASRSGGNVKSSFKIILRYLPRFLTHFLRKMEMASNIHKVNKERNVFCETNLPCQDKKILVVDDAIDTGHSILSVLNFLQAKGFDLDYIKVAALTKTSDVSLNYMDIVLFKQVTMAFPWSYDSREYDQAWEFYQNKKVQVCR